MRHPTVVPARSVLAALLAILVAGVASAGSVEDLAPDTASQAVAESEGLVLVDLWAPW